MANSSGLLFDPNAYDPLRFDPETRRQLRAVIDWFEGRGKCKAQAMTSGLQQNTDGRVARVSHAAQQPNR